MRVLRKIILIVFDSSSVELIQVLLGKFAGVHLDSLELKFPETALSLQLHIRVGIELSSGREIFDVGFENSLAVLSLFCIGGRSLSGFL